LGVKEAQEVVDVDEEETKPGWMVAVSKILAAATDGILARPYLLMDTGFMPYGLTFQSSATPQHRKPIKICRRKVDHLVIRRMNNDLARHHGGNF